MSQNAEIAEENTERKKKKKEREEEEEEMEISSSRPRPCQIQAGDTGRTRRSRSCAATQVAARPTQVALRPKSLRDCLWVFFFFFEHVGAALVVFFCFLFKCKSSL